MTERSTSLDRTSLQKLSPEQRHQAYMTVYEIALEQLIEDPNSGISGYYIPNKENIEKSGANFILKMDRGNEIPLYLLANNSKSRLKKRIGRHPEVPIIYLMNTKDDRKTRSIDVLKEETLDQIDKYLSGYYPVTSSAT